MHRPKNEPPRAAVCFVQLRDGRMLVVWNKRYGTWTMPGGKVEAGETPSEAAIRELREEVGIVGQVTEQIHEGPHGQSVESTRGSYVHVFRIATFSGEPHECEDGCAVTWFSVYEFLAWSSMRDFYRPMFAKLGLADTVLAAPVRDELGKEKKA